jgi:hypothetical protein
MYAAVCLTNFVCVVLFSLLISLCFNVQILQPHENDWMVKILQNFNSHSPYNEFCSKHFSEFPKLVKIYLFSKLCPFSLLIKI